MQMQINHKISLISLDADDVSYRLACGNKARHGRNEGYARRRCPSGLDRSKGDVIVDRQMRKKIEVLENHSDLLTEMIEFFFA